jgi:class 3 adenylate cyclase
MTTEKNELKFVQKYVLFFDICSSTSIIEDLIRLERLKLWRDLLIQLKNFLQDESNKYGYVIYKFIGDGWILLFDKNIQGNNLFSFLKSICIKFDDIYNNNIKGVLSVPIDVVGISFGLDEGSLIKIVMNSQTEYVGRAMNVAARLQGAIKDNDNEPKGKVLMSNKVYVDLKHGIRKSYKIYSVVRNLRNISEGKKYRAKKLCLFIKP